MSLLDLLDKIDFVINSHGGYWSTPWLLLAVVEELGEFSKELQIHADLHPEKKTSMEELEEEFGDLLFTVLALGRGLNLDITKAINNTLEKYLKRKKNEN